MCGDCKNKDICKYVEQPWPKLDGIFKIVCSRKEDLPKTHKIELGDSLNMPKQYPST